MPDKTRLMQLVMSRDQDDQMPPPDRKRVSESDISVLKRWIEAGTPWEPGYQFGHTGYEPPLFPRDVNLPPAADKQTNGVDRILHAYYAEHQVRPPARVHARVFLRRAFMDLIGRSPTIAEQTAFLQQPEDSRRRHLVNQLLSRDRDYAEHWITFWNDLLRNDYAGTGYIDGGRRQITAWLYEALVTNKPYDRFVQELIAPTDASSGFINGIKWRGNVNASQVREIQFAQNVSQVFLGINMKCASCHDSFIDRWTLDEAYGLAAIYSTRRLEVHRCDKPTGRIAAAAWIFPELGEIDSKAEQPERLKQLAALMTSPQNGRFSRTIVNRLWHRLMGHGIVHPVDAMHTEPWSADLLDYLANQLVEQDYNLKKVLQVIATSDAYRSAAAASQDSATAEEFVFRGPEARHLTAEQFMDAVWQLTKSPPKTINAPIPTKLYYGELPDAERTGSWIWTYAETGPSPAGERASFRTTLALDNRPRKAEIVITCDNEYVAWVNGHRAGADQDWQTVESLDVGRHLKAGDNEILIICKNAGNAPNPAGLYAEIVITDASGNKSRTATDQSWQASRQVPKDQNASTVEWSAAAIVEPQNFLGPEAEAAIRSELANAMNESKRVVRASLLKSNLLMRSLGRPNREQVVTTRPATLSTLQAIDLANGEILDNMLAAGAKRLQAQARNQTSFVTKLFQTAVCREPSAEERLLVGSVLGEHPTTESVQDALWLMVVLPEFQFVQ